MAWCLEKAGVPVGATVLDPYMGSGSTAIACIRTGRKFIGIERDPKHFAAALLRIQRELSQPDLFLGGGGAEQVGDGNGESESAAQGHNKEIAKE
jgi:predicted methyltransferase